MSNPYYNGPGSVIAPFTRANAQDVAGQLQAIADAFGRLPVPGEFGDTIVVFDGGYIGLPGGDVFDGGYRG